ncbi:MAG: hypothetical protein GXP31_04410 [Kiritimatiellaeota bacterium]|nr:hypothetical protein [Kiritimatiellota bacterium]
MSRLKLAAVFVLLGPFACTLEARSAEPLTPLPEAPYRALEFDRTRLGPAGWRLNPVPSDWQTVSLDGTWKYKELPLGKAAKDPFANPLDDAGIHEGYYKSDFDDRGWDDFPVPWSWYRAADGGRGKYVSGKLAWYRRTFELKPSQLAGGRRIVLDFRGVAAQADVWVNGRKAGPRHVGRYDSFQYDVTPLARAGANTLAVRVYEWRGDTSYRRRDVGGIYQPVRLLAVPSPLFSNRMMVTSLVERKMIEVEAEFVNPTGSAVTRKLTAEVAHWPTGRVANTLPLRAVAIAPGRHWLQLGRIALPNPVPWSPDNPHLYTLRLADEQGRSVGLQRFGFRDFRARGEWLYLNGKKFKPRGFTFSVRTLSLLHNRDGDTEMLLRFMKSLGINMIRPHSGTGMRRETFYNLCDEIGIAVYEDWSGCCYAHRTGDRNRSDNLLSSWPVYEAHVRDYYSHPCLVMWSFGNEFYEGQGGTYYSANVDKLYGLLKDLDRQGRPICGSTGRYNIGLIQSGLLKERTDVLDDHQYRGATVGSWQDNIDHIEKYARAAFKFYGRPKPKIDCEYAVPGDNLRYRTLTFKRLFPAFQLDPASAEFKRRYIDFLTSKTAEIGGYIRGKLNYCSPRIYVTDEAECRRLYSQKLFKRVVEVYRRAGTRCLGGHTNAQYYDLLLPPGAWGNTASAYGKPGPIPQGRTEWFVMPLAFTVKRVYNPVLVSAGVFNQHPLPGSKQTVPIFVTNDLNEPGTFEVEAQLRLGDSTPVALPRLAFGTMEGMTQKSIPLTFVVPRPAATARGKLELHLFKNGERVGDNDYPVTVVADDSTPIPPGGKVALYDSAERVFRGLITDTTTQALKAVGCRPEPLKSFDELDRYRLLIIGANSFDKTLIDAGERIHRWVKNGGKILCFEQRLCGKVPFYPNYSIVAGSSATYVSMSVPTHPLFRGLEQEDFDNWFGQRGYAFEFALNPLNEGLVAVAPTGSHNDREDARPVIADVKLGKGQIVFSQLTVTKRSASDGVARACLRNLLHYALRDGVSRFALELPEQAFTKSLYVEDKDALFIDLRRAANRGFRDDVQGDRKGGWTDFGASGDFREIPTGPSRLQGKVPFRIIDPASNGGKSCIVLKGEKRPYFPDKVVGIPVGAKLNSVYILHTAMYAKPGPSVRYVFHYANGETREFVATTGRDIPDWWRPKDRANAIVVFRAGKKGLYMSEFANPLPKVEIKTMDIVSYGKSIPVVVAVTGRKRFVSVVAGQGEE